MVCALSVICASNPAGAGPTAAPRFGGAAMAMTAESTAAAATAETIASFEFMTRSLGPMSASRGQAASLVVRRDRQIRLRRSRKVPGFACTGSENAHLGMRITQFVLLL